MGLRATLGLAAVALVVVAGFLYWVLPGRATLRNGSFENLNGRFSADHSINVVCKNHMHLGVKPAPRSSNIDGWTVIGADGLEIDWHADVVQNDCNGDSRASHGNFFIDLAHDTDTTGPTAAVEQVVVVQRAGAFDLSLDVGANAKNSRGGPVMVEVRVEQGGKTLASQSCSSTPPGSSINWQKCTTPTFAAERSPSIAGGLPDLRIVIRGSPNQGLKAFMGVDNVMLRAR